MKVYEPVFHFTPGVHQNRKLELSNMMYNKEKTVQDAMGHAYEREDVVHEHILAD